MIWLALALACDRKDIETPAPADTGVGLVGDSIVDPFPSSLLVGADGKLALPLDALPSGGETPLMLDRTAWRTGFSPAQTSVVRLDGVDASALPSWRDPTPGAGGVVLADLTAGRFLPVMAELDAWEGADPPALLIRPLEAVPPGHRVAVAVTTSAIARADRFDALIDGEPPASLAGVADHFRGVVDDLVALGMERDAIALAWDYPVGDGTLPLRSALSQLDGPGGYTLTRVRDADLGDLVAGPLTWRVGQGTFDVPDFLVDDELLDLQPDGTVRPTGTAQAELYVHVPRSVQGAAPGTVPVLLFGHGIFSSPDLYLDDADDPSGVLQLADEAGFIVVATTWRGLTWDDRVGAIEAGGDFARMPTITDRLVQAQVNQRALLSLVRDGALLQDPLLAGADGQPLADPSATFYYGISLGGIEGMVLLANGAPVGAGVTHVGGSMWSTMLERSSDWPVFEALVTRAVPDPLDRQRLYALSQLWWDPVDPIDYAPELADTDWLLQISIGDEQVPNLTSEALARSAGLPLLEPAVSVPFGIDGVPADLPPGSRAIVQLDPEVPLPPDVNRPAPVTGAHEIPRLWPGTRHQTIDYLLGGKAVVHHCGDAPCSASNPGE